MATKGKGKELLSDKAVQVYIRGAEDKPLHDGAGLYLRRRDAGAYWYLRQTNPETGNRTWMALFDHGGYPDRGLSEARAAADAARKHQQATGNDLLRQRQQDEAEQKRLAEQARRDADEAQRQATLETERNVTVRRLFERWASVELAPHVRGDGKRAGRKDGGQYTREQFERRVFPAFGDVPARDVIKADVLTIMDTLKVEGKLRTANTILADLKQMFAFALKRDIVERDPTVTLSKRDAGGGDVERERVLTVDEIKALAKLVPQAGLNKRSALAVWIILSTGVRVGELMGAVWAGTQARKADLQAIAQDEDVKLGYVDIEAGQWFITETKNQRDHTIHLSDFAVEQFRQLLALNEGSWCFPSSRPAVDEKDSVPVCVKSFGKQLADRQRPEDQRLKNRTKHTEALMLPGGRWTAHDLRRTAASLMADLGFSGDVIDECLNHKIQEKARRVYIRDRRLNDQAKAFDALGARLSELVNGIVAATNVVPIKVA